MRRLLVTRRHVPLDLCDEYLLGWQALRRTTAALGARAWLFRAVAHEDRFLEFIEWQDATVDIPGDEAVIQARAQLDVYAPAEEATEWEEEA